MERHVEEKSAVAVVEEKRIVVVGEKRIVVVVEEKCIVVAAEEKRFVVAVEERRIVIVGEEERSIVVIVEGERTALERTAVTEEPEEPELEMKFDMPTDNRKSKRQALVALAVKQAAVRTTASVTVV